MARIWADRVKETSTTTGTGAFTLAGAMTGFRAFSAVCATNDTANYAIVAVDGSGVPTGDWEVGLGTYSSANTLTRTTVLASSNSGAAVNFAAGTKHVWLDLPASIPAGLEGFTFGLSTASPNGTVPAVSATATNSATHVDLVLRPKGSQGSLLAQVPDSTTTGGNKRSWQCVDWQMSRSAASQVASGQGATIVGGKNNTASGDFAVAGGDGNLASGGRSAAFGQSNTASNGWTHVSGFGNTASGSVAFAHGESNTVAGEYAAAFGKSNSASGQHAHVRGNNNLADSTWSQVTGQWATSRTLIGARVHTSHVFSNQGDCQEMRLTLAGSTTDATPKVLTANGAAAGTTNQLTLQTNSGQVVKGTVVARQASTNDTKTWSFEAGIKRSSGGTVTMVAACTPTVVAADAGAAAWTVTVTADDTNKALKVEFTGEAAKNIRIGCTLTAFEVVG